MAGPTIFAQVKCPCGAVMSMYDWTGHQRDHDLLDSQERARKRRERNRA